MPFFIQMLLPLAVQILRKYVASSETNQDDKILDIVQQGANYLANGKTSNVSQADCNPILKTKMNKDFNNDL